MIWTVTIVVALGCWALRLMEQAYQRQEFSRMLAGMLVVFAAGGVLTAYFLISEYISFMMQGQNLSSTIDPLQGSIVGWLE